MVWRKCEVQARAVSSDFVRISSYVIESRVLQKGDGCLVAPRAAF